MPESSDTGHDARLQALEARVRLLEDHIALYQAVSSYGPQVDSLQHEQATALWTDGGQYVGDTRTMRGRAEIQAMLDGDVHRGLVADGCAHVMSLPLLRIDGDHAIGLGYHRLFHRTADGFELHRLVASRWDWVRTTHGWKAHQRTHRLIDGGDAARELLRDSCREILRQEPGEGPR